MTCQVEWELLPCIGVLTRRVTERRGSLGRTCSTRRWSPPRGAVYRADRTVTLADTVGGEIEVGKSA